MRKLISFGALVALLVGLMAAPVGAVPPPNLHCPSGWDIKVEAYDSELDDVVLPAGTEFCIKAGPGNTGVLNMSNFPAGMTLFEILEYISFLNPGGQTPSVSYYVIYDCGYYSCYPT